MLRKFLSLAVSGFIALSTASCGDTDNEKNDSEPTPEPNGEMNELDPTQSKKFLDETANEFLSKFHAADQRALIEVASWASNEYEDLDFPENFEIDSDESDANPARYMRLLAKALSNADAPGAAAAAVNYTYTLNFGRFAGIYTPGTYQWLKAADSNDIIFRFKNKAGQDCELKAVAAGGSYDANFSIDDYNYDYWVDDNGDFHSTEIPYTDIYKFTVPKTVTVTLVSNGTKLAETIVNSSLDTKAHTFNVDVAVNAANITGSVKAGGNDSKVTQSSFFTVSGETVISSTAEVNGSRLCDIDNYQRLVNKDDDITASDISAIVKNGTATVNAINKVSIDADVKFNADLFNAFDQCWDSYEYKSKDAALADVEKALNALNNNVTATMRYNNTLTEQAIITWKYVLDESYWNWEYEIEPLIKFKADDTTYAFSEYFDSGFPNVDNLWSDLLNNYKKVWENASK